MSSSVNTNTKIGGTQFALLYPQSSVPNHDIDIQTRRHCTMASTYIRSFDCTPLVISLENSVQ